MSGFIIAQCSPVLANWFESVPGFLFLPVLAEGGATASGLLLKNPSETPVVYRDVNFRYGCLRRHHVTWGPSSPFFGRFWSTLKSLGTEKISNNSLTEWWCDTLMTPEGEPVSSSLTKNWARYREKQREEERVAGRQVKHREKYAVEADRCSLGPPKLRRVRSVFVWFWPCEKCPQCLSRGRIIITETTFLTPQLWPLLWPLGEVGGFGGYACFPDSKLQHSRS